MQLPTPVFYPSPVPSDTLSLDGEWDFTLRDQSGKIRVPGTWEAQGYDHKLDGPAVYQLRVNVPVLWHGKRIQLQFDAVSYAVEAEINGVSVGAHVGLWTSFAFDVTDAIHPGVTNHIQLTIYKPGERYPMREVLAGFLPDVCIPFGGVWQSVRLAAFDKAAVHSIWIRNLTASGDLTVQAHMDNALWLIAHVQLIAPDGSTAASLHYTVDAMAIAANFHVDSPQLWYPEHPALYTVEIRLENAAGQIVAQASRKFGFRELSRAGDQLLLNGDPIFLRGILSWGWYPEILCPAPDEQTIRDEFRRVRALGYNLVKLCLYMPSQLYFDIADEEGMLLWLELPMWLPHVTERLRTLAPGEYHDILMQAHTHPSIVIYSLGCELGAAVDDELLRTLNDILRTMTSGILACDNSGSGEAYGGLAFDFADFNDYHFYCDLHNFNPLLDHFRRDWRPARPWIFGEFCDADDYRDLDEIAAGGQLPWWFTEQNPLHKLAFIAYSQQPLRMPPLLQHLPFSGQDIQRISRQQSFVVRKTILEKVRAKAGMGGYVVTGIRDTPLATSSMFDDLGRMKYDDAEFREFNADAVLVLEQGRTRVWKHGGDRPAPVDRFNHLANTPVDFRVVLANSRRHPIGGELHWRLVDLQGEIFASGNNPVEAVPPSSNPREIASLRFTTPNLTSAAQLTLEVEIGDVHNHWPLWVYPPTTLDDSIRILNTFTEQDREFVTNGGCALVLQNGEGTLPGKPVPFWRESIKLIYDHPIMQRFPHQGYADLQFYHLATDYAVDTRAFAQRFLDAPIVKPIIRRLDARQFTLLDYLVEFQIGGGRLLVSTLRFEGGAGDQVQGLQENVAGQYLLGCMVDYLTRPIAPS